MLKLLIEDRREHHRNLKNEARHMKTFAPGDLVIIKKQVQTTQENGPAKARMQSKRTLQSARANQARYVPSPTASYQAYKAQAVGEEL
jgi:hypothetical protein